MKTIRAYYNNNYLFTTQKYNTIKELIKELENKNGEKITIASIPNKTHKIENIKKYSFEIIKK
jgi:hypothetical protein